jgi:hypothetical protein
MSEQLPERPTPILRGVVMSYFAERGLPIGAHEGATIVERPRYSAAFLDFIRGRAGDEANPLLLASAEAKLHAMNVVRTSAHWADRVDFRHWRQEVLERAWLVATEEPVVDMAGHLAAAMQDSNAHEAALDTLAAITVAVEQQDQLSSKSHGV